MATIKVLSSGRFQVRVANKLLPKPCYATFETRAESISFSDHLTAMLAQGIVPQSMTTQRGEVRAAWTVQRCIAEYVRSESFAVSEVKLVDPIRSRVQDLYTRDLNYDWAEGWVRGMKRTDNLSPGTIRHRHGALARCLDWVCRKHPEILQANPLRQFGRGFATYTAEDAVYARAAGGTKREDVERNRRLDEDEC